MQCSRITATPNDSFDMNSPDANNWGSKKKRTITLNQDSPLVRNFGKRCFGNYNVHAVLRMDNIVQQQTGDNAELKYNGF